MLSSRVDPEASHPASLQVVNSVSSTRNVLSSPHILSEACLSREHVPPETPSVTMEPQPLSIP